MDQRSLIADWEKEERAPFRGWDFSHIRGRAVEQAPPWSYEEMGRAVLRGSFSALDLGTGGGEVLARLRDAFPPLMLATEGYPPNVPVARERLEPLGVRVMPYSADETHAPLPFRDGSFGVVLSRHEAYEAGEVARVLRTDGIFLTQQVDGRSLEDLLRTFGAAPRWPEVNLERFSEQLRTVGFAIEESQSWWGTMTFHSVGALVYYLKATPWELPAFSVGRYSSALLDLHQRLTKEGSLRFRIGRFVIRARKL